MRVLKDRVLVEPIKEPLSSVIEVPESVIRPLSSHIKAKVLAVASNLHEPAVGDTVLCSDNVGARLPDGNRVYLIEDILAVVD